jgi:hypothetical protein
MMVDLMRKRALFAKRLKAATAAAGADVLDGDARLAAANHEISALASLLAEASSGAVTRQQSLHWLLHTRHGAGLLTRIRTKRRAPHQEETTTMDDLTTSMDDLEKALSKHGALNFCKAAVAAGSTGTITEHQLSKAIGDFAMLTKRDGETREQAFARVFTSDDDGETFRRAIALAKGPRLTW